jgi:hypothetical protein
MSLFLVAKLRERWFFVLDNTVRPAFTPPLVTVDIGID